MTHSGDNDDARFADSAGVPWSGRRFDPNPFADDDGSAPEVLHEALRRFALGSIGAAEVVAHVADSRFLIPLVAELGEAGVGPSGSTVDKSADLSVVSVSTPDGRSALPVFTSIHTLAGWDPAARPAPVPGLRVALAALSEDTPLVVIDPGADTEFVLRRPALAALAAERPWAAPWEDERILAAFMEPASEFAVITGLVLTPGDPTARLRGPEVTVHLTVMQGLDAGQLREVTSVLSERWREDALISARVDSIGIKLAPDPSARV